MADWTVPRTWDTGELVTADDLNEQLRDNLLFLHEPLSACVYNSANISIPHNTWVILTFDSQRWDNDTIHDTVSNTSRLTCRTAGKYLITGSARFSSNADGGRWIDIFLNGTTTLAMDGAPAISTSPLAISTVYDLSANDYVELRVQQSSGSSLNVLQTATFSPEFAMTRIG